MQNKLGRWVWMILVWTAIVALVATCTSRSTTPSTPAVANPNFDADTQALIAQADRVVFLVPFSHWDTDWHSPFSDYVQLSDRNILAAIQVAKTRPRFRYTLEQVLFVQHFWDTYPQYRADLKTLVMNRQFAFGWAGITQPETSLDAPAVQVRNWQLGRDWITATFGAAYLPDSAWQSDAFGNSAALPLFLNQVGIPYLFIGRWQNRCDPDYQNCLPLPLAFYWRSPVASQSGATPARVLVDYVSYSQTWGSIFNIKAVADQAAALRKSIDGQLQRTESKYLVLPFGFDFLDPTAALPDLVDYWNRLDHRTVLVMADAHTAFQYLATQNLPELAVDMNPIWQAFYDTRPEAKIADKESEYYLTALDKFGLLSQNVPPIDPVAAWNDAAINAHYDNVGGVSFDAVWSSSQWPRFERALSTAADRLAQTLGYLTSGVLAQASAAPSPPVLTIFNPSSWARTEVIELTGDLPDLSPIRNQVQTIGPNDVAVWVPAVPPIGFTTLVGSAEKAQISHPTSAAAAGGKVTLSNGLVSVTLDSGLGGAFSSLALTPASSPPLELLSGPGDDLLYQSDNGDVYGADFGAVVARESQVSAQLSILASGPLLARAQAVFSLGGKPVTKTVSLQADSPLVAVVVDIAALSQTTALAQTPTVLKTRTRTDDLGFGAFEHEVDGRPILAGDSTYRREIFYPIMYWSDVSANGYGLTLVTHGLQGLGGVGTLNLMLVRQVSDHGQEGVSDPGYHRLRYAYLPHAGGAAQAAPWFAAHAFNQPLIPAWRSGDQVQVQIPFRPSSAPYSMRLDNSVPARPLSASLMSADNGIISDLIGQGGQAQAVIIGYDYSRPVIVRFGAKQLTLPASALTLAPVELNP